MAFVLNMICKVCDKVLVTYGSIWLTCEPTNHYSIVMGFAGNISSEFFDQDKYRIQIFHEDGKPHIYTITHEFKEIIRLEHDKLNFDPQNIEKTISKIKTLLPFL